jgi:hypothetical protein
MASHSQVFFRLYVNIETASDGVERVTSWRVPLSWFPCLIRFVCVLSFFLDRNECDFTHNFILSLELNAGMERLQSLGNYYNIKAARIHLVLFCEWLSFSGLVK